MSKRKKRSTRAAGEAVAASPTPPATEEFASQPAAHGPQRNLPALVIAGSLWVGWFFYLVWVAATRK